MTGQKKIVKPSVTPKIVTAMCYPDVCTCRKCTKLKTCVHILVCMCMCVSHLLFLNVYESSTDHPPIFSMCVCVCVLPANESQWNPTNHNWPLYVNIQLLAGEPPPDLADLKLSKGGTSPWGTEGKKRISKRLEVRRKAMVKDRLKWGNITLRG